MSDRDWKGATLYDACDRPEALTHESPEEALAEWLDGEIACAGAETDAEVAAWLRAEESECEVVGWRRMSLDGAPIWLAAREAAVLVVDRLHEAGITDPDEALSVAEPRCERIQDAILAATVRILRDEGGPWGCEEVARHTYDAEAIIEALGLES